MNLHRILFNGNPTIITELMFLKTYGSTKVQTVLLAMLYVVADDYSEKHQKTWSTQRHFWATDQPLSWTDSRFLSVAEALARVGTQWLSLRCFTGPVTISEFYFHRHSAASHMSYEDSDEHAWYVQIGKKLRHGFFAVLKAKISYLAGACSNHITSVIVITYW